MFRRVLSITISIALICLQSNTLLSEILPPNSSVTNRPTINTYQTTLGTVPVINIVKPNNTGLSHNKYDKFNIDKQGAVLNNSQKNAYSQIIGETISANPNLTTTAKVILNEVLTARSNIFGTLEILGQKADIIIANAYGISVNGGNFINAGKVSLITGTPTENNLNKYIMGTGNLEIGQEGLINSEDINLVSSQMEISGAVTAKELQIATGNTEYDMEQNQITSQGNEEVTAIDISASMYADKIKILSSKQDNKIEIKKNANLISNVDDIEIDAQGNINIKGTLQSNKDIKLNGETITNNGKISAQNNITIEADVLENKYLTDNLEYTKETVITNAEAPKIFVSEVLKEYEKIKEISYGKTAEIEAGNKLSINSNEFKNIGSTIKADKIEINSNKIINEILLDTAKIPVLYTYDVYKWLFIPVYDKTYTTEKEEEILLQKRAEIIGNDIKITGTELANTSSKIQATGTIDINVQKQTKKAADNIDYTTEEAIEKIKKETDEKIKVGNLRLISYEEAKINHSLLPGEIIGKDINLQAEEIINDSSIIQAEQKLTVIGTNLTNTSTIFEDFLDKKYQYIFSANASTPYLFSSNTAGQISGNEIEINLTGDLKQENYDNSKFLIRAYNEETDKKVISNISGTKVNITAQGIENSGKFESSNELNIKTEQDFINNNGIIIAKNIDIVAGHDFINNISLVTYENKLSSLFLSAKIKESKIDTSGIIVSTQDNLNIKAGNDIIIKGLTLISNKDINLEAKNNLNLLSQEYENSYISGSYKDIYSGTIIGSVLAYGNLKIKGKNELIQHNIFSNKKTEIEAEEDIEIRNSQTKKYLEKIVRNSGGTFGTSSTDIYRKKTIENIKTKLEAGEDITIKAGNKITLQGTDITSDGTINLISEKDDINIVGVLDYEATEHSKKESGTLGLTGMSKTDIKEKMTLNESVLNAKGGINISGGNDTNIFGSNIYSDKDTIIQALNYINIGSIKEQNYNYYRKETKDFNFGESITDLYSSLLSTPFKFYSEMATEGKYTFFEASYDIEENKKGKTKVTNKASNIESKEKLTLKSGKEATILASNITANEIENDTSKTNVISEQDKETVITEKKETRLKVGFEISNAYVNAYKAVDNVVKAAEAQARAEEELSRIEELHKQGKASDKALKQAKDNVAIARANIVFLTAMAAGSAAGAAASYETLGFGVGGTATYETKETKTTQETITNIASNLIANKNILINTGEYNQIGSNLFSLSGDIFINANNANISASKDTFNLTTESKSYNMSATYGTNGGYGSVGYNQSSQEQYAEKHNNSQIQAGGKVEINTTGDTTLKGANVKGKDVNITAENLTIESLQDKSNTTGSSFGANIGAGVSKGGASGTVGFESGSIDNKSAWVNSQSSIIASDNLNIKVKDTTDVKGAVIASETDNLTLDTGKLKYSDIKDYDTQNSSNIGFTVSDGQYDNESILRTGNEHDTLTTKITLKDQGQEKEQLTKATIGNGKIIVGGQEQTEEDLQGLNRDVNNSQTITKDQITAALDAELNVDVKLLVSLVDAIYNGDPNKISVVKDYKKVKEKIQEILVERRRTELEKNIKKIKFSKDKEKQKEIEEKLQLDEEIIKLQTANDNKKILKEYLKKNKLSSEVIEQIEKIGATGEYYFEINSEGKLYAVKTSEADSARNNIFLSTDYLYNDITTNEKFLNIFLPGSYEEIYASTMREASKSMAEILLETSPQLRNISNDTNQIVKDTGNLILEMAKSSGDKQTYKTALKAIKEIPNNIKETYTATTKASNVENLQQIGYSIGDKAYDYKENPMLLAKDATSLFISYDMYEAGFNNDNMFYGSALVLGGLALDIAGAPIKAGKGIVKTAKATEKIANATKELKVAENLAKDSSKYLGKDVANNQLAIRGATFEGTIYRNIGSNYNPLSINVHNINMPYRYSPEGIPGLYFASSERIVKSELAKYNTSYIAKDRITYSYSVKLTNMLDVTNPTTRLQLGVNLNDIIGNSYETTHRIGNYAYKNGYNGIIAPSARGDGGVNIILFNTEELGYAGNKIK